MLPTTQLDSVYVMYAPTVRRLLSRLGITESDVDDLVQETFVTVHRLLPSFEGRSSLPTWLHAIAWRIAANHRRRQRRTVTSGLLDVPEVPRELELGAARYEETLRQVSSPQRDLLALHEVGGLSISFMAELTGHARATVRHNLARARAEQRRALRFRSSEPPAAKASASSGESSEHLPEDVPVAHAPELRVLRDGQTCITTVEHIVLVLWRGHCSTESLSELFATFRIHAQRHPGGICYFAVVEPESTPPDRNGRAMIVQAARELGPRIKAHATWVEGSLRIQLAAAVMNATMFLARAKIDTLYFGELESALRWLSQYGALDRAQIRAQIARMKERLDQEPARPV